MPHKDPAARAAYQRRYHQKRRAAGFCANCTKLAIPGTSRCESCREHRNNPVAVKPKSSPGKGEAT